MKRVIGSKNGLLISSAFLLAILTILNSCSKTTDYNTPSTNPGTKGGPGTNEVWLQNMAFSPVTITVTPGTTIKWTNKDQTAHTVTSDNGLFDSGSMENGSTFSMQFNTVGTFSYHCTFHSMMTGSVIVK